MANLDSYEEETPQGRLACIAREIAKDIFVRYRDRAGYSDFRDAFMVPVARELLAARIAEALACGRPDRVRELELELESLRLL